MGEILEDFGSIIKINGTVLSNLCFIKDIDLMGGTKTEVQELATRLGDKARAHGSEHGEEQGQGE